MGKVHRISYCLVCRSVYSIIFLISCHIFCTDEGENVAYFARDDAA